jgi:hypothetical protein
MVKKSKHGMTSEQASERNLAGRAREYERASEIPGAKVINGIEKPDILRIDGKTESVKGGTKTQWGLYCLQTILSSNLSDTQKESLKKYMNFLPDDVGVYLKNKEMFKKNTYVIDVYDEFYDKPIELIKYFCGNNKVDYFTLIDNRDGKTYCVDAEIFFEKINNSIKKVYTTNGGKFVIAGGEKNTILFELEMRKGTNHKKILFHSLLSRIIDVVK